MSIHRRDRTPRIPMPMPTQNISIPKQNIIIRAEQANIDGSAIVHFGFDNADITSGRAYCASEIGKRRCSAAELEDIAQAAGFHHFDVGEGKDKQHVFGVNGVLEHGFKGEPIKVRDMSDTTSPTFPKSAWDGTPPNEAECSEHFPVNKIV